MAAQCLLTDALDEGNVGGANGVGGVAVTHAGHQGDSLHHLVERAAADRGVVVPDVVRLAHVALRTLPEVVVHGVEVGHVLQERLHGAAWISCYNKQIERLSDFFKCQPQRFKRQNYKAFAEA